MKKQRQPIKLALYTDKMGQTIVCDRITGRKIEGIRNLEIKYDTDHLRTPVIHIEFYPGESEFKQK